MASRTSQTITCRAPSKFSPPGCWVFPSVKNPTFFVVDKNPPTIEVTTTRFIIIFWCCSCLKHPTNLWWIRNLEFLKSLLNLAPSLFWVIFGILKTPSFKFKAPISLKLFFVRTWVWTGTTSKISKFSIQTKKQKRWCPYQWSFLVPLIGGRYHTITQLAIYKWYISGIYCHVGDYMWFCDLLGGQKDLSSFLFLWSSSAIFVRIF